VRNTTRVGPGEPAMGRLGAGTKTRGQENVQGNLEVDLERMRNRRPRGRKKSSAAPVERRRLGPGKASSRHGDEGEAVLAGFVESGSHAHRDMARTGIGGDRDRDVRGSVARNVENRGNPGQAQKPGGGRTRPHEMRAIRRSARCVVKRTDLRSRWAAPHRVHARRRVGDDEPGRDGVRVLVDGVLGSRNGSDASRSRSMSSGYVKSVAREPQGNSSVRDLA